VRLVFQRQSFDPVAATFVGTLLRCCIFGAPIYLIRDVAVRVFYVLGTHVLLLPPIPDSMGHLSHPHFPDTGEGKIPFWISVAAIAGNAFMDWLCVAHLGLGNARVNRSCSVGCIVDRQMLNGLELMN